MRRAMIIGALCCCAVACGKVEPGDGDGDGDGDADAAVDAPESAVVDLGMLRDLPDGDVDVVVEGVVVTYVHGNGFHVQRDRTGPAIHVFLGAGVPTGVDVGNRVDLHVTQLGTFQGNKQVTAHEVVANDMGNFDVVSNLAQDLVAAGIGPGEDLESELVLAPLAGLDAIIDNNNYTISFNIAGVNVTAHVFSPIGALASCAVGQNVMVRRAVDTEFGGMHQIFADVAGDLICN